MAVASFTCLDCSGTFPRTGSRGPIPKRCDTCRSRLRADETARWHTAHPEAQKRYTAERTERKRDARGTRTCRVCGSEFTPKRERSTYCTKLCYLADYDSDSIEQARETLARRLEARATAADDGLCEHCREQPRRIGDTGRAARFCSHRCMRAWHTRARRHTPTYLHGKNNYAHKQRAAAFGGSTAGVTTREWNRILAFYGDRCAYCGSTELIERDHVVPITRGGGHEPSNVVPACRPCNRSKGDQLIEEWRPGLTLDRFTT